MKPPARAVVGNLIWSTDGGVWALWRVSPFAHAHTSASDKLAVHGRLKGMLIGLPSESMLLSVCERLDAWDVVASMLDDVDVDERPAWGEVCRATADELSETPLHRRLYYVAAALDGKGGQGAWRDALRAAAEDVASTFGLSPMAVSPNELDVRRSQARAIEVRLAAHVNLAKATAGEIRWLYARTLRRGPNEPVLDEGWEPPARPSRRGENRLNVLAPLSDAVVKEGGYRDDPGRPRHHRYVRIDSGGVTNYHAAFCVADMPHEFTFPGGGGEWLFHVDDLGFPIDWCVRVRSVPNAESQIKVRRQHRQLIGQVDEYDGEMTGAPPSLAEAIAAVDGQRSKLAANPTEPELQVTMIFSITATDLPELEDRAGAIGALFEPHEYGVFRPTGGQAALIRSMMPGTAAAPVCKDYTQFLMPGDLAAGAPFCGPEVGDPQGLLLGVALDGGGGSPVLMDPTYGPRVGRTASLAAVGALGSGKSFFLKRLCWDTIARGGQIVTIDRTSIGEYVAFANVVPGRAQVVRLATDTDVCLDPLRTFTGDDRVAVTLGFLSLLAGCSAHSDEGAALAEAVHTVADASRDARLSDVVDELHRLGADQERPDEAARSLARRLSHYRRLGVGRLAFGDGEPVSLDADCIVFWAPNMALPDRDTLIHEHLARQMLPEQILGHALLYLVAAVGRKVVFQDPSRFGAALYDEAWALLASPHGQRLLLEGIRDGRKHNGAIWLASQHPNDLGTGELVDLVGSRFVFRQSPGAIDAATRFLGAEDSAEAAHVLGHGLGTGQCLYRDVRDRIGLIQVLEPVLDELRAAFDTTPHSAAGGHTTAARARRALDADRRASLASGATSGPVAPDPVAVGAGAPGADDPFGSSDPLDSLDSADSFLDGEEIAGELPPGVTPTPAPGPTPPALPDPAPAAGEQPVAGREPPPVPAAPPEPGQELVVEPDRVVRRGPGVGPAPTPERFVEPVAGPQPPRVPPVPEPASPAGPEPEPWAERVSAPEQVVEPEPVVGRDRGFGPVSLPEPAHEPVVEPGSVVPGGPGVGPPSEPERFVEPVSGLESPPVPPTPSEPVPERAVEGEPLPGPEPGLGDEPSPRPEPAVWREPGEPAPGPERVAPDPVPEPAARPDLEPLARPAPEPAAGPDPVPEPESEPVAEREREGEDDGEGESPPGVRPVAVPAAQGDPPEGDGRTGASPPSRDQRTVAAAARERARRRRRTPLGDALGRRGR